jgi:hypothetical protein
MKTKINETILYDWRIIFSVKIISVIALLVTLLGLTSKQSQAQTPIPTPVPILTRTPGFFAQASPDTPQNPQSTVMSTASTVAVIPPSPDDPQSFSYFLSKSTCNQVLMHSDHQRVWTVSTTKLIIDDLFPTSHLFDDTLFDNTLWVQFCGDNPDPNAQFLLVAPNGRRFALRSHGQKRSWDYIFSRNDLAGTYQLQDGTGATVKNIQVAHFLDDYPGMQFTLSDAETGLASSVFSAGQKVRLEYRSGYGQKNTGLYYAYDNQPPQHSGLSGSYQLVELWPFELPTESYTEISNFSAAMPTGEYLLVTGSQQDATIDIRDFQLQTENLIQRGKFNDGAYQTGGVYDYFQRLTIVKTPPV